MQGYLLLPRSAYCFFFANSNSQLSSTSLQATQVFIWFYVSFRQVSFNHSSVDHIPELSTKSVLLHHNWWSSRRKTKWGLGGGVRRKKILKWGWVLITNIEHIFAERSLHKQMAAFCCSAHVPCHNSEWFSSSISFILESHPLIWLRETYPPSPWHHINHINATPQQCKLRKP